MPPPVRPSDRLQVNLSLIILTLVCPGQLARVYLCVGPGRLEPHCKLVAVALVRLARVTISSRLPSPNSGGHKAQLFVALYSDVDFKLASRTKFIVENAIETSEVS